MVNRALSIVAVLVVIVAAVAVFVYGGVLGGIRPTPSASAQLTPSPGSGTATPGPPSTPTPSPSPSPTPLDSAINASAVVVPVRYADVAMSASGVVQSIYVTLDQQVAVGQLLLRLDQTTILADIAVAQDEVDRAQAIVDRATLQLEQLPSDAPPAQAELAQADLRLAQAELDLARSRLSAAQTELGKTELRAPIAGTVTSIDVTQGEQAEAGETLLTIADISSWVIDTTDITELEVVRIAVGDRATATFPALPNEVLTGVVERIQVRGTTEAGDVRFTVSIKPDQPVEGLRWNMTANVRITPN